mgnify:CR=1 FL=1
MCWKTCLSAVWAGILLLSVGCAPTIGQFDGARPNPVAPAPRPRPEPAVVEDNWNDGLEVEVGPAVKPQKRQWQAVYFAYDQSAIGSAERVKLDRIFDYLREHDQYALLIEGHCDKRGSEEYNRALGERRALAVRQYLADRGLAGERLRTISYGEERPAAEGETEKAFQQNRRAELIVLPPGMAASRP